MVKESGEDASQVPHFDGLPGADSWEDSLRETRTYYLRKP